MHRSASLARFLPLGAVVVLASVLRVWRLRVGLPDFLDEAIPFKQALEMWGWSTGRLDLNPHFFHYPSLAIYLHFLMQKAHYGIGLLLGAWAGPHDYRLLYEIDPTGPVVAARLLGFLADIATVAAAWRLGDRLRRGAGLPAALIVALSPALIAASRAVRVDPIMVALLAWSVERLLAWQGDGGRWRLAAAVALAGLAAGAKYPAGCLVVPLAGALWLRDGARGLRRWPLLAAAAAAAFLLSSPYVALDFGAFRFHFVSEGRHMAEGHLGTLGQTGALFYARGLLAEFGWPGVALWLLSLSGLRRGAPARGAVALLWLALLPFLASLAVFRMEAERYLLPLIPLVAALVAATALTLPERLRAGAGARRAGRAALLALLLLPLAAAGLTAAMHGSDSTQQQARRWCERSFADDVLLLQEPYGARLLTDIDVERIIRAPFFARAAEATRQRFLARRTYRAVTLPMLVSGRMTITLDPAESPATRLTVLPHSAQYNEAFYDPSLLLGVDYLLVSGAVRNRYQAAPALYPVQNAFYALLASHAWVAASFAPGHGVTGPEIVIYRLDKGFWWHMERNHGPLDIFWWTRPVPADYRDSADRLLVPAALRSGGACRDPAGRTAAWVQSLRPPFDLYVRSFAVSMGQFLAELGRLAEARRYAAAVLAVAPDAATVALPFSFCATNTGDAPAARQALEATLASLARDGQDSPDVRQELERVQRLLDEEAAAPAP